MDFGNLLGNRLKGNRPRNGFSNSLWDRLEGNRLRNHDRESRMGNLVYGNLYPGKRGSPEGEVESKKLRLRENMMGKPAQESFS